MPFSYPNNIPSALKGKDCPSSMIKMFIVVWNKVYKDSKDEKKAFRITWDQISKRFKKVGNTWEAKSSYDLKVDEYEELWEDKE